MLCVFSIFRHEGSSARRICKGAFHSPGKKSPVLASLVRYFLPFALDKYSVLRWQVFRKKEKKCCSLAGCPFCHSVTGICPHGGRSAPISRTRNIILSLPAAPFLGVPCGYRYHFEILRYAKALKPPEKTPPEAIIESLCIVSTKCGNDTQITVLQ